MKIVTTSVVPKRGNAKMGSNRVALVDVFLVDTAMSLRGLELAFDGTDWSVNPPECAGLRTVAWVRGSAFERALAESASKAFKAIEPGELEFLRDWHASYRAA